MSFQEYPLITDEEGIPFLICGIGSHDSQPPVKRSEGYCIHQILYVTSGCGLLIHNGQKFEVKKNDIILLKPNIPHEYYPTKEPWGVNWITFTGCGLETCFNKFDLTSNFIVHLHNIEPIDLVFQKLVNLLRSKSKNKVYRCSPILYELILEIFYQKSDDNNQQLQIEDGYLTTAINYMNQNYSLPLSLEDIALKAQISPEYLCILFKRHMHMRPFEYLSKKRIQIAKHLLLDTSMPIADVGKSVGYDSNSYFGYVFKKYEMMSPSQFRDYSR